MKKMRMLSIMLAALCCCCTAWGLVPTEETRIELKEGSSLEMNMESIAGMEKSIKKVVNSGVRVALPYLMQAATEIRLSGKCMQGLLMVMRGVMDIKDWAIRMVDAIGKPTAGVLEGTATFMGDYDECLNIVAPRRMRPVPIPPYKPNQIAFQGQYCAVQIHLPDVLRQALVNYQAGNRSHSDLANSKTFLRNLVKMSPRADIANIQLGVCLPSVCTNNDLQAIVNQVTDMIKISATVLRCEKKEPMTIKPEQIFILCAIGALMCIVLAGTGAEMFIHFKNKEPIDDILLEKRSHVVKSLMVFSAPRNIRKLFSLVPNDTPMISSIRGLKFLIACLYIVVWTFASPSDFHFLKYRGAFHFFDFMEQWWFTVFANASAGIDAVFLIAGLQISYRLWWKSKIEKTGINIPKFILKWYIRMTLSQVIVISLLLCLPLLSYGPVFGNVVSPVIENCEQRWWMNILAINNFFASEKMCLPHTWLTCCLMHLLILAPIILLILSKSISIGLFVNIILVLGSSAAIAMVTLMNELPPAPAFYFISFINLKPMWEKLFVQAYDHIGPFCIGMLLGFFFNRYKEITLNKKTVIISWCCALICMSAVMCGLYGYYRGEPMEMTLAAIYASLHRIGFSLGFAWILFACAYGYGGCINSFLSWKLFIPFERLANYIFLLHPIILFLHQGQLRDNMYYSLLDQAMYATAYVVFTIATAICVYVTCVSPFLYFEKWAWSYFSKENSETNTVETELKKVKEGPSCSGYNTKEKFEFFRNSVRVQEKKEKIVKK